MAKISKGFKGYVTDSSTIKEWAESIGGLMLNFGAVELQTYLWLEALSGDEEEVIKAAKNQFSWRMNRVRKLIKDQDFGEDVEAEMLKVWDCSDELSKFRNKIAHNPIFLSYKSREAEGEPDYIGIPSFRKSKKDQAPFETVNLCPIKKLKLAVDAVHENVCNLTELYDSHLQTSV